MKCLSVECIRQAELQAKHAARAARLVTSGDGFLTHMETSRSTSGELPPQLGPPAPPGQPNLEFLPVLPPMHVHSHPVTTGQGPPVRAAHVRALPSSIFWSFENLPFDDKSGCAP